MICRDCGRPTEKGIAVCRICLAKKVDPAFARRIERIERIAPFALQAALPKTSDGWNKLDEQLIAGNEQLSTLIFRRAMRVAEYFSDYLDGWVEAQVPPSLAQPPNVCVLDQKETD
jgi:hypothetical protein